MKLWFADLFIVVVVHCSSSRDTIASTLEKASTSSMTRFLMQNERIEDPVCRDLQHEHSELRSLDLQPLLKDNIPNGDALAKFSLAAINRCFVGEHRRNDSRLFPVQGSRYNDWVHLRRIRG